MLMPPPNTLGLDDDLDGVELLQNLEFSFGIKFLNEEAMSCWTVGDLSRLVQSHLHDCDIGARCATAMAFYRLRRAFSLIGAEPRLTPATGLKDIPLPSPKAAFRQIQDTYPEMRLPLLPLSTAGQGGLALLLIGAISAIVTLAIAPRWSLFPVLGAAVGAALMRWERGRFPPECRTLGDLARKVAGLNFFALTKAGARYRQADICVAILEILTEHSSLPRSEIRDETLLLHSQMRAELAFEPGKQNAEDNVE